MMSDGSNGLPHLGNGGVLTAMSPHEKEKRLPLEAAPDIQTFLQTNKVAKLTKLILLLKTFRRLLLQSSLQLNLARFFFRIGSMVIPMQRHMTI